MRSALFFLLTIILVVVLTDNAKAQYPILDQEPASLKWKEANTSKFNIIYQEGNDSMAIGLARRLQALYAPISRSLNAYPKKLSVVLRNQTTVPNGFVTLAPRRSEFFTMPPQDYNFAGSNQWLDLLAIHEYRHVVQFEKAKTGFNKLLYYVFGEEALAGMSFIAVPQWFWEGDAVAIETALTPSGRGRIPDFNMVFRTNLLERGAYSYNKQYLRSFKDFIPDHYVTGYYMVTHLRRRHKMNPWDNILDQAFGKPFIPFTFSRAIRKETGLNVVETYRQMTTEIRDSWLRQVQQIDTTTATIITPAQRKTFTNYMFPQVCDNGDIIALKTGIGDITQLVRISGDGEVETEVVTGFMANSGMLSAQGEMVVWNEYRPDIRWGARTSNDIKLYNLSSGKIQSLTGPSRYSAAALSPDLSQIVTVYVSETNEYFLTIIDSATGKERYRFPNPENHFISMPRWSDDGQSIVALLTTDEGKSILLADVESGSMEELITRRHENFGHPVKYGRYVLYNSAYSGIDNIYAVDVSTGEQYQITSRPYGAFNPTLNVTGDTLIFNDYQVNGMEIAKMPFIPQSWKPLGEVHDVSLQYYQPVVEQEQNFPLELDDKAIDIQVSRYSKLNRSLNVHSWGVLLTESGNELAVGMRSRNVLGTNVLSAGYAFNPFEATGYVYGRASYQGWFPIIDLDVNIGRRSVEEEFRSNDSTFTESLEWQERKAALGIRVPLNFTHSKFSQRVLFETKAGITQVRDYNSSYRKVDQQANGLLKSASYSIRYSRLLKVSHRDLYSRWGQIFQAGYEHTPFGGDYHGGLAYVQAQFFNPGFFKHHSFYIRGGFQQQDYLSGYRFRGRLLYPRGHSYTAFEKFYMASLNYSLPLFYPDWSIGPLFYFQRVRANVFHDRGWASVPQNSRRFEISSSGVEVSVDFNFMRFLPIFNLGVRYVYLHDQARYETQLIIGSIGI